MAGTNGAGLLKFDREGRKFIAYRNNPVDPESIGQDSVISLFEDREGNLWAGLGGMGLTRLSTTPLPFKRYRHDFGDSQSTGEPLLVRSTKIVKEFYGSETTTHSTVLTALPGSPPRTGPADQERRAM